MKNTLTNLPISKSNGSDNATLMAFDNYYNLPLQLDSNIFYAVKGFFESRGFAANTAETLCVTILRQCKIDNINPMQVLDTLKGLDNVEISALVSEIVNFNRYKTSYVGYALEFRANEEVARNIIV